MADKVIWIRELSVPHRRLAGPLLGRAGCHLGRSGPLLPFWFSSSPGYTDLSRKPPAERERSQGPGAASVRPRPPAGLTPQTSVSPPLASRGHQLLSPPPHPSPVASNTPGFSDPPPFDPYLSQFPEKLLGFRSRPRLFRLPCFDPSTCSLGLAAQRPPVSLAAWIARFGR